MANSIARSTISNGSRSGVTEHSITRLVPGDIASIRQRTIEALESLNYLVLSEEPLNAKRNGSFSMNVLDCALELTILFRQSNPLSTTATFNYTIALSMLTKGDLHTVEREAEALIALATARQTANVCVGCGTSNSGDSRFCRACGVPSAGGLPAELEVMRLTAGTRAGHQTIVTGILIIILSILLFALPLIFIGGVRRETVLWVLLTLGQVTGWATLFYGMHRLHRTLNPKANVQPLSSPNVPRTIPSVEPAALPPKSARTSVTEGTTELLDARGRKRTAVRVDRHGVDTGAMNQD